MQLGRAVTAPMVTWMHSDRCLPRLGVEVGIHRESFLAPSRFRLSVEEFHSFIHQTFNEPLLCARLFSRCWGDGSEKEKIKITAPMGFTYHRGEVVTKIKYRACWITAKEKIHGKMSRYEVFAFVGVPEWVERKILLRS